MADSTKAHSTTYRAQKTQQTSAHKCCVTQRATIAVYWVHLQKMQHVTVIGLGCRALLMLMQHFMQVTCDCIIICDTIQPLAAIQINHLSSLHTHTQCWCYYQPSSVPETKHKILLCNWHKTKLVSRYERTTHLEDRIWDARQTPVAGCTATWTQAKLSNLVSFTQQWRSFQLHNDYHACRQTISNNSHIWYHHLLLSHTMLSTLPLL